MGGDRGSQQGIADDLPDLWDVVGELGDDDDRMMWAGLYHLYLTSLPVRQFMQREPMPA